MEAIDVSIMTRCLAGLVVAVILCTLLYIALDKLLGRWQ